MYAKHLKFGKIINIDIFEGEYKGRYVSVIKDYEEINNVLYINKPRLADIFISLKKNEKMAVRFIAGTMPCLYNAEVIDIIETPDSEIYKITGPNKVSKNDKRKFLRLPSPPLPIIYKSTAKPLLPLKAMLVDVSFGGLNIEVFSNHRTGEELILNFKISKKNGEIININELSVIVVWQSIFNERRFLGVKFGRFKINQETHIKNYITFLQRNTNWEMHKQKVIGVDI